MILEIITISFSPDTTIYDMRMIAESIKEYYGIPLLFGIIKAGRTQGPLAIGLMGELGDCFFTLATCTV